MFVEECDGSNSTEIIFERDVFVRGMRVFVRQSEPQEDARNFEGVVHLSYEWDRTALSDENSFLSKARFECVNRFLENRMRIRRHPGFSRAQNFELALDCLREKLADMLFNELRDFRGV